MIDETPCTCCHLRPAQPDRYLCRDCCDQWHADLQAAPDWLTELDTETARRTRKTSSTGHAPAGREQPLPINLRAADHASMLSLHLTACIAILGHGEAPAMPDTDTRVDWLLSHEAEVALHPAGGPLAWRLRELTRQAARICDRPAERVYVGTCPCGERLMAAGPVVTCRGCGTPYDADDARQALLDSVADQWMTVDEIAALLGRARGTVWSWADRGRLTQDPDNPRQFRLGDALALSA